MGRLRCNDDGIVRFFRVNVRWVKLNNDILAKTRGCSYILCFGNKGIKVNDSFRKLILTKLCAKQVVTAIAKL